MMGRSYLLATCAFHAVAIVADQAISGPPTKTVLSVVPHNVSSSLPYMGPNVELAYNLGDDPSIIKLDFMPTVSMQNFSIGNQSRVGPLLLGSSTTLNDIDTSNIAVISCDPQYYVDSSIYMYQAVNAAINAAVVAVVFASVTADTCLTNASIKTSSPFVFTTTNATDAMRLLKVLESANSTAAPLGSIASASLFSNTTKNPLLDGKATLTHPDDNDDGNDISDSGSDGSPSTAVAMIILYSITGVITFLFLLVIITGAVRAHRHPERYGPHIAGRRNQSRAQGLARAMLETLPIVKFAAPAPEPKGDVELGSSTRPATSATGEGEGHIAHEKDIETSDLHRSSSIISGPVKEASSSIRSGIGPAAAAVESPIVGGSSAVASPRPTTADDNPGCSICTDDFEPGQDLRLLPCGHKFHPACVDPWLLNVSGTCPLCRVDLNRGPSKADAGEAGLSPTAGSDSNDPGTPSRSRRLSRMALGRFLHTAPLRIRTRQGSRPLSVSQYAGVSLFSPAEGQTPHDDRVTTHDASAISPASPLTDAPHETSSTAASDGRHGR